MLLERNVFRVKFGKAKEVKALYKEMLKLESGDGMENVRALTDLTGPAYTFVIEMTHKSLADFENNLQKVFTSKEWQELYQKMVPFFESGYREFFTIVD